MSEKVILEEGGSVSVHTRIKDMCKSARNRLGLTNQDICDLIEKRFGISDFSVNTVSNFFSERSKATTIYTTGYICAVLGISIDAVFGIENELTTEKEVEFVRQLADLKVDLRFKDQEIDHLKDTLAAKGSQLEKAHSVIDHYRQEIDASSKKVQPWVFITVLSLLAVSVALIIAYLLIFDVNNPGYGIFTAV